MADYKDYYENPEKDDYSIPDRYMDHAGAGTGKSINDAADRLSASAHGWTTKDSGQRAEFESGMVRDTEDGKPRFDLIVPLEIPYTDQMLTRFAGLMARGAEKYTERNWEQAHTEKELSRYYSSAFRHFMQWLHGETDEDHAAAVFFNITAAESVKWKLKNSEKTKNWN